jgi:hypothetical protein
MPVECRCYQVGLAVWTETREADEQDSSVKEMLAEDKPSEILVRGQQDCVCLPALAENRFVVDTRVEFGNKQDIVSVSAEPIDNLLVDVLIRDDFHPASFSTGYTTSARSTSAAKAIAARIPADVSRGCSDKIWSSVSPAASFSRINSTVIRVPVIVGLPIMILGSDVIGACGMGNTVHSQSTTLTLDNFELGT